MIRTILLIIACIILIINIILTILEARIYYYESFHQGFIRGESGAHKSISGRDEYPDRIRICGMWYNVKWIITGKEGVINRDL